MKQAKRYLVTSALPYANGPLHIGHLTGAYIPADIYVRYLRMTGADVLFICGSDEHGAAITIRAKKEGTTAKAIVDQYHPLNKQNFADFGISFDLYHRTSDPLHHQTSSDFFKTLYDKGVFVEKESEQYYDEAAQQFLADRYITGTCPKCEHPAAYGDQCEKCGSSLSPHELINPVSTLSKETPVLKKTKHWYLPMGRFQETIKQWVDETQQTESWKKHVLGQCRSWLNDQLQDRAMTRDLDWGVKVPLPNAAGKVLYVWLDAPIGYISATKALTNDWKKYWQDEDTKLVHFIGKDNIVFHCIIFPMLLQAHGDYILPTNVPANQFMNLEGDKVSTSRNWAVWLNDYLQEFPDQQDVLRYVLTVNMPENKDSEFTWKDFQNRNNTELVGVLGNFVNRVLVLINKYFKGTIPENLDFSELSNEQSEIKNALAQMPKQLDQYIHQYEFRKALESVLSVARLGNKFLNDAEPWRVIKTDEAKAAAILSLGLELIAYLSVYLQPFLPFTTPKLQAMIQLKAEDTAAILAGEFSVSAGHQINKPSLLFKKVEDKTIDEQLEKFRNILEAREAAQQAETQEPVTPTYEPLKPTITFDDFSKLDIRTGTIIAAQKMKKANKLFQLTVDLGFEQRTVVSGIAQQFAPDEIIGQKVLLLANLAPRKLRGVESQGMVLMAGNGASLQFTAAMESENGEQVA